jgi:hypothetical protein
MAVPTPKPLFKQFFRIQAESSYGAGGGSADWNIGGNGGGTVGWRDLPVVPGSVNIEPVETAIFAEVATGKRAMNQQPPVGGLYDVTGSFEMPAFPELVDPILLGVMGGVARVETAGSAAKSAVSFASLATLDTQSDGTEVLKFVIASSTAASGASIDIIQNAVTVETITIGTNAGSVDGNYYSLGAYDGSVNAITFSIAGTVTSGMVTVSGVDFVTNTFTMADTNNSYKIEEAGQPRSASDSSFYTGAALVDAVFSFDKTAADGLLTLTTNFAAQFPASATVGTFGNHAALYYNPLAGWNVTFTKDGAAYDKVTTLDFTIHGGTELFQVASGDQNPGGLSYGSQWIEGTVGILAEDATEWNDFVGQTEADYHIIFTSPQNIVDTTKWTITIEATKLYLETYVEDTQQDNLFGASLGIRTVEDSSDGIVKITVVSRLAA